MSLIKNYFKCSDEELREDNLCRCKYCNKLTDYSSSMMCPNCQQIKAHAEYNVQAANKIINDMLLKGGVG